jgi:alkanesulfonate monooxygenase SsuD/methylene tetrahydromethanopterin reductase-like flavin-dependent oxidoreductase (luciferase family)
MKLSVSVTNYSWSDRIPERMAGLARLLDRTSVDTLWVADHLLQADPSSRLDEPMLEAYTALGFLAASTSRLRLGTMVTAATFRAPAAPCAWSPSSATPAICSTSLMAAR